MNEESIINKSKRNQTEKKTAESNNENTEIIKDTTGKGINVTENKNTNYVENTIDEAKLKKTCNENTENLKKTTEKGTT